MGEAKRRGTLEQRAAESEVKRRAELAELQRLRFERWSALSPEQKEKVAKAIAARQAGTVIIDESSQLKPPIKSIKPSRA